MTSNSCVRVALADDHTLFRKTLADALNFDKDLDVVFHVGNGAELLHKLTNHQVDVVLLDLHMPMMNGFEALKLIRARHKHVKVIVVSLESEISIIEQSFAHGASAHLSKDCDIDDLLDAIQTVYTQGYYFLDNFPKNLINKILSNSAVSSTSSEFVLSRREKDIIRLICQEKGSQEISQELHIAQRTVENHRYHISKKIGTSKSVGILVFALLNGLASIKSDGSVSFD